MNVTVNGETLAQTLTVHARRTSAPWRSEPEPAATEAANTEFRNAVWPLYEQPAARKSCGVGGFV